MPLRKFRPIALNIQIMENVSITLTKEELEEIVTVAVSKALNKATELPPAEEFLSIRQAMEYLSCSRDFLLKKRKDGTITAIPIGGKTLFRRQDLDVFAKIAEEEGNGE
jgi:excisionase family DNA binding protein